MTKATRNSPPRTSPIVTIDTPLHESRLGSPSATRQKDLTCGPQKVIGEERNRRSIKKVRRGEIRSTIHPAKPSRNASDLDRNYNGTYGLES
jgi:hypothetical protein